MPKMRATGRKGGGGLKAKQKQSNSSTNSKMRLALARVARNHSGSSSSHTHAMPMTNRQYHNFLSDEYMTISSATGTELLDEVQKTRETQRYCKEYRRILFSESCENVWDRHIKTTRMLQNVKATDDEQQTLPVGYAFSRARNRSNRSASASLMRLFSPKPTHEKIQPSINVISPQSQTTAPTQTAIDNTVPENQSLLAVRDHDPLQSTDDKHGSTGPKSSSQENKLSTGFNASMVSSTSNQTMRDQLKNLNRRLKKTPLAKIHPKFSYKRHSIHPVTKSVKHRRLLPNDRRTALAYGINQPKVESRSLAGMCSTFYHTMLDRSWNSILTVLALSYLFSVISFANVYYWMERITRDVTRTFELPGREDYEEAGGACITGLTTDAGNHSIGSDTSFVKALLLALESQTTIGYGARYPLDQCLWPLCVQAVQYLVNSILLGHVLLIVTSRMIKRRDLEIVQYSDKAVICERDSHLYLIVRLAPKHNQPTMLRRITPKHIFMNESNCFELVGVTVSAKVIITRYTVEDEFVPLQEFDVPFENADSLFANIPIDYAHRIDEDSPFYEIGQRRLEDPYINLEFIVISTATIASTGTTYQTKHSYVSKDILYGHRFQPCIYRTKLHYEVDFGNFNSCEAIPGFNMMSLEEREEDFRQQNESQQSMSTPVLGTPTEVKFDTQTPKVGPVPFSDDSPESVINLAYRMTPRKTTRASTEASETRSRFTVETVDQDPYLDRKSKVE